MMSIDQKTEQPEKVILFTANCGGYDGPQGLIPQHTFLRKEMGRPRGHALCERCLERYMADAQDYNKLNVQAKQD